MKKLSKPGTVENQKIRFNVKKKGIFLFLLFAWGIPALACTRSVKYPDDPATSFPISTLPATQTPEILQAATITPGSTIDPVTPTIDLTTSPTPVPPVLYYTQSGDTLPVLSVRFNVNPDEIISPETLPATSLLKPNLLLIIPNRLGNTTPADILFPDSEVVFSPSAVDFDVEAFVNEAGGYLSTYSQWLSTGNITGAQVIEKVAIENSINPRLLLALLEYQSNWVYGQPANLAQTEYPMGYIDYAYKDLYHQLAWAVQQLSIGYYGWRAGLLTELCFPNGETLRIAPTVNAGTVAIQYLFSQLYYAQQWAGNLYTPDGITGLHERMFGNYWVRAQSVEPLYPTDLSQPELELPFYAGTIWSLTGGPHSAWGKDGALSALDFAPAANENGCVESFEWVTASAPGVITRSENGVVVLDLDGDGNEQTGWAILYLHIATKDRVAVGTKLPLEGKIGHPSCEGGLATGTHVHIARKYNGEWILADGPMPFNLSGWTAHNGLAPYKGNLTKGDLIVTASTVGSYESRISR
jgi:LysM repeat protein